MTKKKYSLILGISMLLFVLSFGLLFAGFALKEKSAAACYVLLISAAICFIATLTVLFKNRKAVIEYESSKRKPSKKSLKKAEKRANKMIKKADKTAENVTQEEK
jgi:Na+/melibiose symporter-like transporter